LPHPIGAVVEAEHAVAGPDPGRARDHARRYELVRLTGLVRLPDGGERIRRRAAHAVHHRVVRDLGALPALVAVHRVVAAHHRRDDGAAAVLAEQIHELLHEAEPRLRRSVAPVEPCVDCHRQVVEVAEHDGGDQVLIERVHAAVADQAKEVERTATPLHGRAQLDQRRQAEELAGLDRLGDAHDVLRHDATRAEVQVSHFAVADLALGKSHREPRRVEEGAWRPAPEAVPRGRVPELDGIAFAAGAEAPAVEHDQDDRGARPIPLCHIGGDAI
jgi:hypothetical protein